MKPIEALEKEIIDEFQDLVDVDAKYVYLFKLGNDLPELDASFKNDENLVKGCQSTLWFHLYEDQGLLYLDADSDSMVIKGIAALFVKLINGRRAEEVTNVRMDFIDRLNIWKLASERNNGLMAMLDHIKHQAMNIGSETTLDERGSREL